MSGGSFDSSCFCNKFLHSNVVGIKTIMGYPSKTDMSVRSDGCSFLCVRIESRAVGRSENPGRGGSSSNGMGIICPLDEIGLTDLSKYGRVAGQSPPHSSSSDGPAKSVRNSPSKHTGFGVKIFYVLGLCFIITEASMRIQQRIS